MLATQYDAALLLLAAGDDLLDGGSLPDELLIVLDQAPCDVALLARAVSGGSTGPIITPFGGADHDWSAIELAAWLARCARDHVAARRNRGRRRTRPPRCQPATRPRLATRPAAGRHRHRAGRSSPRARTAYSKPHRTRGCWSSVSLTAGGRKESARHEQPSPRAPVSRPCSCGAASDPAESRQARHSPASPGRSDRPKPGGSAQPA